MKIPDNLILNIFGASGDLAFRKLIPAIYSLKIQNLLPAKFEIIGIGRSAISDEDFRRKLKKGIISFSGETNIGDNLVDSFTEHISYLSLDSSSSADYEKLRNILADIDARSGTGSNYVFYLATPPGLYPIIAGNLAGARLSDQSTGFRRIIFEKPFGYDLKSCRALNKKLHDLFSEEQIFRIDHYLGKETVQNLLVTRFSNGMFEPLWNRNYISYIEITSSESIGVENRGGYYDTAGALRDMVQNHLLQMVGLTAMESPSSMNPDAIRNEIPKVFQSFQPISEDEVEKYVIRGQIQLRV